MRPRKGSEPANVPGLLLQPVIGVAAAPDSGTIRKIAGLQASIGSALQGRAGGVVGYDRGDPAHSYAGVIAGAPSPAAAGYGAIKTPANAVYDPSATIQDMALTDPSLDPYNRLLLARMQQS